MVRWVRASSIRYPTWPKARIVLARQVAHPLPSVDRIELTLQLTPSVDCTALHLRVYPWMPALNHAPRPGMPEREGSRPPSVQEFGQNHFRETRLDYRPRVMVRPSGQSWMSAPLSTATL